MEEQKASGDGSPDAVSWCVEAMVIA